MKRLLIVLLSIAVCASCGTKGVHRSRSQGPHAVNQLGLEAPLRLEKVNVYEDGGTLSVLLQDATGKKQWFCFDGRELEPAPRCLFIGVSHASQGGTRVPLGDPVERSLIAVLQALIDEEVPRDRQAWLLETNSVLIVPENYVDFWYILRCIESRRSQIEDIDDGS